MEAIAGEVRKMVSEGCSLIVVLEFLRSAESFKLTPLNFMRVLNEAAGIQMIESRELISMFDPEMSPVVSTADLELQWRSTIDARRG